MKSLKPKNRTRKNHIWENFVKNFAKKSLSGAILLVWAVLAPRVARAQGEASIWGLVTDSSGAAVPAAAVKVQNAETGADPHI